MRFNTGIAAMMEFVNGAYKWEERPKAALEQFVLILAPYAPHLAEEMWQVSATAMGCSIRISACVAYGSQLMQHLILSLCSICSGIVWLQMDMHSNHCAAAVWSYVHEPQKCCTARSGCASQHAEDWLKNSMHCLHQRRLNLCITKVGCYNLFCSSPLLCFNRFWDTTTH